MAVEVVVQQKSLLEEAPTMVEEAIVAVRRLLLYPSVHW